MKRLLRTTTQHNHRANGLLHTQWAPDLLLQRICPQHQLECTVHCMLIPSSPSLVFPPVRGGSRGGLQGAVAPPFPVPTTPLIYTSTRLTVESATKKLKGRSVLDFFQRKQLVTVRMNQIQSQLVLGTKTGFSVQTTCTANLRRTWH